MKKALFLLFIFHSAICSSQYTNPVASRMGTEFIQADQYVGEDAYGFQYFIKNNVFFKKNKDSFFQYKNISLGKIKQVDLQNPLRIVLFYQDFNTIIALDNQLSEVQKINLSEHSPNIIASAIGVASQNNYWIFDAASQQLYLFNYIKNTTQSIGNPFTKKIITYTSDFNYFYWIDEDNQLQASDLFGKKTLLGNIPKHDQAFICSEKLVTYKSEEKLYFFDLTQSKSIPIKEVENSFISFYYKNQNLAIFTPEGITNYKINLP